MAKKCGSPLDVGTTGEHLVIEKLKSLSIKVQTQVETKTGTKTQTGKDARYLSDIVTDKWVLEIKTCARTGTPEKLGDAVHRLAITSESLHRRPFLIVLGAKYEFHIKNDAAFKRALRSEPNVVVFTYNEFIDFINENN